MTEPRKAWADSRRVVPGDWQTRKRKCLATHKGICHVCKQPGATEVDHVIPVAEGGTHEPDNLRPIHPRPCHQDKTKAESRRGVKRRPRMYRDPEPHPGLLRPGEQRTD